MGHQLAVRERGVGGGRHGAEVRLALRRAERRTGELAVPHRDAVAAHGLVESPQVVGPDLMAEAARAAVEHDEDLAGPLDAEGLRHPRIVNRRPGGTTWTSR